MGLFLDEEEFNDECCANLMEILNGNDAEKKIREFAKSIVENFSPKTVLDCSCVDGSLVLELRKLGVAAFGLIPYRSLVDSFSSELLQCCFYGSILKDFEKLKTDKKYDLVVCLKDEEFLKGLNFELYINRLMQISDNVLFGVLEKEEKSPENLAFISSVFFKNNMFRRLNYCLNIFNHNIYLFSNFSNENAYRIIKKYEHNLNDKEKTIAKLENELTKLKKRIVIYCKNMVILKKLSKDYYTQTKNLKTAQVTLQQVNQNNMELQNYVKCYNEIRVSFFWRITAPIRIFLTLIKRILRFCKKFAKYFFKALYKRQVMENLKLLFNLGLLKFYRLVINKVRNNRTSIATGRDYVSAWKYYYKRVAPTKREIEKQKKVNFKTKIVFSIVVPVYRTPKQYLVEMIESVLAQSYPYWQLCLVDGTEPDEVSFSYVGECCEEYVKKDSRIIYKKIGKNLGIAGNTNVALELAKGEYICLLDHDDVLSPIALFENAKVINKTGADVIYSDEMTFENKLTNVTFMHFKQDYAPDTLTSSNYICHFLVFSSKLQKEVGCFSGEYDGSQDYDFIFRLTEKAKKIEHIPKLLYYWRATKNSAAKDAMLKPYCIESSKKAIRAHLNRMGREGEVVLGAHYTLFRVKYKIIEEAKISILIPNKDHIVDLEKCIKSILEKSTYQNYEILILENGSRFETIDYYNVLKQLDERIKVVKYNGNFNYSAINNHGVNFAAGKYLIFLNNDTEVISPNWIEEMLMYAQREDVGAVGAKLYFNDDTIQHAGVIIGIDGTGGHGHKFFPRGHNGYAGRASIVQNVSAVTGACMMVSKRAFYDVGGFDEALRVSFNDVDFCLRLMFNGYLNVFTPYAELYHYESKSRGYPDTAEKYAEMLIEADIVCKRWAELYKKGDPFYNVNLTRKREDFMVRLEKYENEFGRIIPESENVDD